MTKKYDFKGTEFLLDEAPPEGLSSMKGYVVTYAKTPSISATIRIAEKPAELYWLTCSSARFDTEALSTKVQRSLVWERSRHEYNSWDEVMTSVAGLFTAVATDLETIQQNKESNDAWFDSLPDA